MKGAKRHHDYDAVFDYIVEYKTAHDGLSPTLREIMDNCSISSTSVVSYILTQLEQEGKIVRFGQKDRAIMIPGGRWVRPRVATYIPMEEEQVT